LAFEHWKTKYGFPNEKTNRAAKRFYSDAIICAAYPDLAKQLIDGMHAQRKAEMGVFGLARLIQRNLDAFERGKKDKKQSKPSCGPWETKRERQLQENLDHVSYDYNALLAENVKLVNANLKLMMALDAALDTLPPMVRDAVDDWQKVWQGLVDQPEVDNPF
jgi:hypothetical protein